jgi:hypothetical protein
MSHATCEDCGRAMDPGVGCVLTHVRTDDGEPVLRIRVGEGDDWGAPICHDCNAATGQLHHMGCDVERCPKCGGQMLMCIGEPDEFGGCGWTYALTTTETHISES